MSEPISVATVGPAATKVVVDAPAPTPVPAPVDTPAPKPDDAVPPGQDAKDPNLGRAFAALARKDEALRNRESQVKKESERVKALDAALETARSKKDPVALLQLAGIEPSELTDILIALGREPSEADRIAALEAARKGDADKAEKDSIAAEAAQLEAAKTNFRGVLASSAKSAGDKFELTLAHGDDGIDLAFECVDAHWNTTGKVLPIEEALALAESHYDAEAKKLLSTKKYGQNRPATSSESTGARADNAPDTLTNNHVSGGPPADKRVPLTRDQSIAAAAALMESRGWGKR